MKIEKDEMEKIILRKFKMSDANNLMKNFVNDKILKNVNLPKKAKELSKSDEIKWLNETFK